MAEDLNSHPPGDTGPEKDVETLGGILGAARDRHGLTVEQVAAELRIEPRLLEALEHHRFETLPAPVFVKGYLRQLASRFGLEHDNLVRLYAVQTDAKDAPITYNEPIPEDNKLTAPLIIGVLVLVLGIPAFWFTWVSRDTFPSFLFPDEEAPESPPAQVDPVPEEAAPFPVPDVAVEPAAQPSAVDIDPVQPPALESAPGDAADPNDTATTDNTAIESGPADPPVAGDAPPTAGDVSPPAGDDPPVETDAADPAQADEQQPAGAVPTLTGDEAPVAAIPAVEPQPADPATAEPESANVTDTVATGAAAGPGAAGPLVEVVISYVEDSWTEVTDGNGNSLYYALGMAGTTTNLEGAPPLSFVLGRPAGVQLSVNDRPWPIPEPEGDTTTARFVVEEAP